MDYDYPPAVEPPLNHLTRKAQGLNQPITRRRNQQSFYLPCGQCVLSSSVFSREYNCKQNSVL